MPPYDFIEQLTGSLSGIKSNIAALEEERLRDALAAKQTPDISGGEALTSIIFSALPTLLGYAIAGNAGGVAGAKAGGLAGAGYLENIEKRGREEQAKYELEALLGGEQIKQERERYNTVADTALKAQVSRAEEEARYAPDGVRDKYERGLIEARNKGRLAGQPTIDQLEADTLNKGQVFGPGESIPVGVSERVAGMRAAAARAREVQGRHTDKPLPATVLSEVADLDVHRAAMEPIRKIAEEYRNKPGAKITKALIFNELSKWPTTEANTAKRWLDFFATDLGLRMNQGGHGFSNQDRQRFEALLANGEVLSTDLPEVLDHLARSMEIRIESLLGSYQSQNPYASNAAALRKTVDLPGDAAPPAPPATGQVSKVAPRRNQFESEAEYEKALDNFLAQHGRTVR